MKTIINKFSNPEVSENIDNIEVNRETAKALLNIINNVGVSDHLINKINNDIKRHIDAKLVTYDQNGQLIEANRKYLDPSMVNGNLEISETNGGLGTINSIEGLTNQFITNFDKNWDNFNGADIDNSGLRQVMANIANENGVYGEISLNHETGHIIIEPKNDSYVDKIIVSEWGNSEKVYKQVSSYDINLEIEQPIIEQNGELNIITPEMINTTTIVDNLNIAEEKLPYTIVNDGTGNLGKKAGPGGLTIGNAYYPEGSIHFD